MRLGETRLSYSHDRGHRRAMAGPETQMNAAGYTGIKGGPVFWSLNSVSCVSYTPEGAAA